MSYLITLLLFVSALKELLLEKQNLLTKTTQELSELGSYKVIYKKNFKMTCSKKLQSNEKEETFKNSSL